MALSAESVEKGRKALTLINRNINSDYISEFRKGDRLGTDRVYGSGRVQDGWENLFTHIQNMTNDQKEMWEKHKNVIHNSSFTEKEDANGITCIGWF